MRAILDAEEQWLMFGEPYFKVFPQIAREMAKTEIDIQARFLRMPYPSFTVMFPDDFPVRAAMYAEIPESTPERPIYFTSLQFWKSDQTLACGIPLKPTHTIEEALQNPQKVGGGIPGFSAEETREMVTFVFRVAIATAFFGVNQHELIMPDLRRKEIDAMQRAGFRHDDSRIAEIMRKARERLQWTLGKEYELPAPLIRMHGEAGESEGERKFAHMRRGHLRFQPCGPGRQDTKLVFVRPTD